MTLTETEVYMKERGYTLHSFSGSGKDTCMSYISDRGIYAEIKLSTGQCQLSFMHGFLSVSTGWIQFPHPRFSTMWEVPMLNAYNLLVNRDNI